MSSKNGDKYVNWKVFTWAIGLIVLALGAVFSIILTFKGDVSVIKTDINYIKKDIVTIKKTLTADIAMQVPEDEDFRAAVFVDELIAP